jgi:ketosteroid isomerase-like protein
MRPGLHSPSRSCQDPPIAAMAEHDHVEQVRALWKAYERDGVAGMRRLVGPDVEWVPYSGGGTVLEGPDALDAFSERHEIRTTVHGFEAHGSCVLVHGSLRVFRAGGFLDVQPSWVYFFAGGRLVRAVAYATRQEALAAIEEFSERT